MEKAQRGFTLIEGVISLFFFLLILLFSFECFVSLRKHFAELKESESSRSAVLAAMDRMRRDIKTAGLGLKEIMALQILEGVSEYQGMLIVWSKEEDLAVGESLSAGQQRIPIPDARAVKRGHRIGVFDRGKGEVHAVSSADRSSIVIDSPLMSDFPMGETRVILLRKVSLFLDKAKGIIRRKVNSSPAQPLLESVASFNFNYEQDANLVWLSLILELDEEKIYETTVFPKNMAVVPAH
jgi:hypothetical protein